MELFSIYATANEIMMLTEPLVSTKVSPE